MDKILSSKLVFKCPKFRVYEEKVLLVTNKITIRWQIIYNDSVVIIGITNNKHMILINEYREGLGKKILLLPGGGVKEGEKITDAALREFEEETGYVGDRIEPLTVFDESNSKIRHKIYYFVIKDIKFKKQNLEIDEEIEVLLFPFEKILELIKNKILNDKNDVKAIKLLIDD